MAITQNPIIGQARKKFANGVFYTLGGQNILRSKALTVNNPRTDNQMKQRSKMAIVVSLAKSLSSHIRRGFIEGLAKHKPYNRFVSENMNNDFLSFVSNAWVPDFTKFVTAKGSLDPTSVTSDLHTTGGSSLTINFPNTASGNQSLADTATIVVISENAGGGSSGEFSRNSGTAVVILDAGLVAGETVHVYLSFVNSAGNKASDNSYYSFVV